MAALSNLDDGLDHVTLETALARLKLLMKQALTYFGLDLGDQLPSITSRRLVAPTACAPWLPWQKASGSSDARGSSPTRNGIDRHGGNQFLSASEPSA